MTHKQTIKLSKKLMKKAIKLLGKYMAVNSLVNLDCGRNYITYNYSIFDFLMNNRGEASGVKPERVGKFIKLVEQDKYYFDLAVILVNKKGVILDGRHRFEQAKACSLPVLFCITDDERLNINNGFELACNIAIFNAHNPKWESNDNYKTAFLFKRPLAIEMDIVMGGVAARIKGIESANFKATQLIHLLDFTHTSTLLRARTLEEFDRNDLLLVLKDKVFLSGLNDVVSIIAHIATHGAHVRSSKVVESLARLLKTNPHFSIKQCAKNVESLGTYDITNENKKKLDNLFLEYGNLEHGNVQYRKFRIV